jgi:hypothetical protein
MRTNVIRLSRIVSVSDLSAEIARLEVLKESQEEVLKDQLETFAHSINPGVMIKKAFRKMGEDETIKQSAIQSSLNLGAQFLLDKIMLRKGVGIKGYLLNMALKRIASFLISKRAAPAAGK